MSVAAATCRTQAAYTQQQFPVPCRHVLVVLKDEAITFLALLTWELLFLVQ
jgi:hypothetical protein